MIDDTKGVSQIDRLIVDDTIGVWQILDNGRLHYKCMADFRFWQVRLQLYGRF